MITTNETGPDKGRFLFTVFETDQAGVQRHDLLTGETDTIWHSLTEGSHVSFDPSFWTPWGTLITGGRVVHRRRGMHEPVWSPVRIQESCRCAAHLRTSRPEQQ
jgi:hypothetical protein